MTQSSTVNNVRNNNHTAICHALTTLSILFLAFCQNVSANTFAVETACANAVVADLTDTHWGVAADAEATHLVRLEVPSAGILTMVATTSDSDTAEPQMSLFRSRCADAANAVDVVTIERSAGRLALAVRIPGTYYFRLEAQDRSQTLDRYALTSGFVAATVRADKFLLEPELASIFEVKNLTVTRTHFFDASPSGSASLLLSIASFDSRRLSSAGESETDPDNVTSGESETDPDNITALPSKSGESETDPDNITQDAGESATTHLILSYEKRQTEDFDLFSSASAQLLENILWPESFTPDNALVAVIRSETSIRR